VSAPTVPQALGEARTQLGQGEHPPGSNDTTYGRWYGLNPAAWCGMFVSWVLAHIGATTPPFPRYAYTPTGAAWFQAHKLWGRKPRPGAIVFYKWANSNRICHTGIVEGVRSDGRFVTIEGNVGDRVQRLVRSMTYVVGFGYPAYAAVPTSPPIHPPQGLQYRVALATMALRSGPAVDAHGAPAGRVLHTITKDTKMIYLGMNASGTATKLQHGKILGWVQNHDAHGKPNLKVSD
jgi:hypothetical protein